MKILFVSHSSQISGAENVLFQLLKGLPKDQFDCHCVLPECGVLEEKIRSIGVNSYIIKLKWLINGSENPIFQISDFVDGLRDRIEKLLEIINVNKIDLVVSNTSVIFDGALAAKIAGIPHIWHVHEILRTNLGLKSPLDLHSLYSLMLSLSDCIVTVSKVVKDEIENSIGYSTSKIKVIYNGIEINSNPIRNKTNVPLVLSVGCVWRGKGFMTLLEAAKIVNESLPEVKFAIAGNIWNTQYYKELLKKRRQLGLRSVFEFYGFRRDINSILENSSIFVSSSLSEAFPMTILEAMNTAVPVIATNCGGCLEQIDDGKTGFLVSIGDSHKLAEKMIYLLKNEEINSEMGKEGYTRVKNIFNNKKFIEEFSNLFKIVVNNPKQTQNIFSIGINELIGILNSIGWHNTEIKESLYIGETFKKSFGFKIYKKFKKVKKVIKKFVYSKLLVKG